MLQISSLVSLHCGVVLDWMLWREVGATRCPLTRCRDGVMCSDRDSERGVHGTL